MPAGGRQDECHFEDGRFKASLLRELADSARILRDVVLMPQACRDDGKRECEQNSQADYPEDTRAGLPDHCVK